METNKTWIVTKTILLVQFFLILGAILLMWILEGISEWVFNFLGNPKPLPMVMNVVEMTSYMFFGFGLANFHFLYKRFLLHGLTRTTVLQGYILGTVVGVLIYTVIMGLIMSLSNLDVTADYLVYYLIKLFFDGLISFLIGSMIIFGFYQSKKLGFLLLIPALLGYFIKIYIWLGFYGVINPSISSTNAPDFNIVVSTIASAIFSIMLYLILKRFSNQMPIKI